jgi:hypothetical protein
MVTTSYMVHGTGVKIGWDSDAVRVQLQRLCAYFGLVAAPSESVGCPINLTWHQQGVPVALPTKARPVAEHHGIQAWQADTQFYLSDGTGFIRLDPVVGLGVGTFLAAPSTPPTIHRDLFLYSLLWLLRAQGWYAAHAACLPTGNGGCLIVADSGSGKSTLALGLLQAGWHYLTDEAILLQPRGEQVEVRPLRRDLYLEPEAETLFPDTHGHWQPCLLREDTKQHLDVQTIYPTQVRDTCCPDLLLFPTIADAPQSRLIPVGKTEALYHLIQQSALVTVEPQMAPGHLDLLARLVRQTQHYRLLAGQDLARDPRRIAQLLEEVQQPAPCA